MLYLTAKSLRHPYPSFLARSSWRLTTSSTVWKTSSTSTITMIEHHHYHHGQYCSYHEQKQNENQNHIQKTTTAKEKKSFHFIDLECPVKVNDYHHHRLIRSEEDRKTQPQSTSTKGSSSSFQFPRKSAFSPTSSRYNLRLKSNMNLNANSITNEVIPSSQSHTHSYRSKATSPSSSSMKISKFSYYTYNKEDSLASSPDLSPNYHNHNQNHSYKHDPPSFRNSYFDESWVLEEDVDYGKRTSTAMPWYQTIRKGDNNNSNNTNSSGSGSRRRRSRSSSNSKHIHHASNYQMENKKHMNQESCHFQSFQDRSSNDSFSRRENIDSQSSNSPISHVEEELYFHLDDSTIKKAFLLQTHPDFFSTSSQARQKAINTENLKILENILEKQQNINQDRHNVRNLIFYIKNQSKKMDIFVDTKSKVRYSICQKVHIALDGDIYQSLYRVLSPEIRKKIAIESRKQTKSKNYNGKNSELDRQRPSRMGEVDQSNDILKKRSLFHMSSIGDNLNSITTAEQIQILLENQRNEIAKRHKYYNKKNTLLEFLMDVSKPSTQSLIQRRQLGSEKIRTLQRQIREEYGFHKVDSSQLEWCSTVQVKLYETLSDLLRENFADDDSRTCLHYTPENTTLNGNHSQDHENTRYRQQLFKGFDLIFVDYPHQFAEKIQVKNNPETKSQQVFSTKTNAANQVHSKVDGNTLGFHVPKSLKMSVDLVEGWIRLRPSDPPSFWYEILSSVLHSTNEKLMTKAKRKSSTPLSQISFEETKKKCLHPPSRVEKSLKTLKQEMDTDRRLRFAPYLTRKLEPNGQEENSSPTTNHRQQFDEVFDINDTKTKNNSFDDDHKIERIEVASLNIVKGITCSYKEFYEFIESVIKYTDTTDSSLSHSRLPCEIEKTIVRVESNCGRRASVTPDGELQVSKNISIPSLFASIVQKRDEIAMQQNLNKEKSFLLQVMVNGRKNNIPYGKNGDDEHESNNLSLSTFFRSIRYDAPVTKTQAILAYGSLLELFRIYGNYFPITKVKTEVERIQGILERQENVADITLVETDNGKDSITNLKGESYSNQEELHEKNDAMIKACETNEEKIRNLLRYLLAVDIRIGTNYSLSKEGHIILPYDFVIY